MNEQILNELIQMIEVKVGKRKTITRNTTLEDEAGMTGDDAVEFLLDYSKRYNVDLTDFDIRIYFTAEGDSILSGIIHTIIGRKVLKQKDLTVGDLENGIIQKRLV